MGVFDDKRFDELDWISQATEPIESELNTYLSNLPDKYSIDFATYIAMIGDSYGLNISVSAAVRFLMNKNGINRSNATWEQMDAVEKCFQFEITGNPVLNFKESTIANGTIDLIKIGILDEKTLEGLLGQRGIQTASGLYVSNPGSISRLNEVMEILGKCDNGLRARSPRMKRRAVVDRLKEIFKTNEWKIKNADLADKVGIWTYQYVVNNNLAAWSNLCRLKVMTHKNQCIYSMEEVV